jgi:hypothetical protein
VDGFEHLFSGLILCQPDPEIRRRPFLGFPADDGAKVKGCFFFKKKKNYYYFSPCACRSSCLMDILGNVAVAANF